MMIVDEKPFATDVILDMTRRFAELYRKGKKEDAHDIFIAIKKLEELYPEAKEFIHKTYGVIKS